MSWEPDGLDPEAFEKLFGAPPPGCVGNFFATVIGFAVALFCWAFLGSSFLGVIAGGITYVVLLVLFSDGKFMEPVKTSDGHGRFCTQCGQPSDSGDKFCNQCGHKLRPK